VLLYDLVFILLQAVVQGLALFTHKIGNGPKSHHLVLTTGVVRALGGSLAMAVVALRTES
jgi:hypothetical protein